MLTIIALAATALFQAPQSYVGDPNIFVPASTIEHVRAFGVPPRAHTNHLIYIGPGAGEIDPSQPTHGPAAFIPVGYGPDDLRAAYSQPSVGGAGKAIAIVDAYHYPTALNDFNVFAAQYGLPQETSSNPTASSNQAFRVVYQGSSQPTADASWSQEEALDIEWAHAMAPNAKIYLVEANSASVVDLLTAVRKAATLPGVKAISMSWGASEFSGEVSYDSANFMHSGIVYFASSGDVGGVKSWPSVSPNVVAVGGTHLLVAGGVFSSESAWVDAGGGRSTYYGRPTFQNLATFLVGNKRGAPDVAAVADPNTGCRVYDSTPYNNLSGWLIFGGTSLSCPCVAGMYVTAGAPSTNSAMELRRIYHAIGSFRDITSGTAGSFTAAAGWDFITGVGSPVGSTGF